MELQSVSESEDERLPAVEQPQGGGDRKHRRRRVNDRKLSCAATGSFTAPSTGSVT